MQKENVVTALEEARRFIKAGEAALIKGEINSISGCKYSAACKRASLDLTRALAEMRKPNSY